MLASLRRLPMAAWRIPNRNPRCIDKRVSLGYGRFVHYWQSSLACPVGPPLVDLGGPAAPPVCPNTDRQHAARTATVQSSSLTRGRRVYLARLHTEQTPTVYASVVHRARAHYGKPGRSGQAA